MNVSVVIPTFKRDLSLRRTISSLAASKRNGFATLEIVVVDDGSPIPAAPIVAAVGVSGSIARLSVIRQPNSGPAAARNNGFRATSGDLVLFVDDDIEVPPGLVSAHVEAHHRHSGSVVFGRCVLPDDSIDPLLRHVLDGLGGDAEQRSLAQYEARRILASGQISVPRSLFSARGSVYCDELRTPAAEEYELSARLMKSHIPILRANQITALHRTELSLERVCHGQYGHGWGCAEAAVQAPETLELLELRRIIEGVDGSRLPKRTAGSPAGRFVLVRLARLAARLSTRHAITTLLYRWLLGSHFTAGVRDGLRHYRILARRLEASRG